MKKILISCFCTLGFFWMMAQPVEETAIKKVISEQVEAWNKGNIEAFMQGYWQDDSLMFIGHGGVTYGYTNTLNGYKKTYDSPDKMGKLFFSGITMKQLSGEYYFITGKWFLKRNAGDIGGYYTLLFRKIGGRWLIVCDHTS
jgi:ketosteroid isomerase-like protein